MARLIGGLGLAFDIVVGSLRLLRMYPVLIVPLLPVFIMVLGLEFALVFFVQDLIPAIILIYVVAFELMFSFSITGNMIHQIHEDRKPSLVEAVTSPTTLKLIPKVLLISLVWFTLVLIIVALELAIKSLLNRGDGGSERVGGFINSIFGTVADALRMMGFMMIPIMIFEKVGVPQAFRQLKSTLANNPITALSGLVLTKLATTLIFLIIYGINQLFDTISFNAMLFTFAVFGIGWILSMYLEQLFATGLYLYSSLPQSRVVAILLEKHLGRELPVVPVPETPGVQTSPSTG